MLMVIIPLLEERTLALAISFENIMSTTLVCALALASIYTLHTVGCVIPTTCTTVAVSVIRLVNDPALSAECIQSAFASWMTSRLTAATKGTVPRPVLGGDCSLQWWFDNVERTVVEGSSSDMPMTDNDVQLELGVTGTV